jgi:hypothetical protein
VKQLVCGIAFVLLLAFSVFALAANFAKTRFKIDLATKNQNTVSVLPVSIKYRGGDVSSDGGGTYSSSVDNSVNLYAVIAGASALIVFGSLSGYVLMRWNKKQKLRSILKSLRKQ